eukprot:jgi/Mesvir1/15351/Mv06555-RA.1
MLDSEAILSRSSSQSPARSLANKKKGVEQTVRSAALATAASAKAAVEEARLAVASQNAKSEKRGRKVEDRSGPSAEPAVPSLAPTEPGSPLGRVLSHTASLARSGSIGASFKEKAPNKDKGGGGSEESPNEDESLEDSGSNWYNRDSERDNSQGPSVVGWLPTTRVRLSTDLPPEVLNRRMTVGNKVTSPLAKRGGAGGIGGRADSPVGFGLSSPRHYPPPPGQVVSPEAVKALDTGAMFVTLRQPPQQGGGGQGFLRDEMYASDPGVAQARPHINDLDNGPWAHGRTRSDKTEPGGFGVGMDSNMRHEGERRQKLAESRRRRMQFGAWYLDPDKFHIRDGPEGDEGGHAHAGKAKGKGGHEGASGSPENSLALGSYYVSKVYKGYIRSKGERVPHYLERIPTPEDARERGRAEAAAAAANGAGVAAMESDGCTSDGGEISPKGRPTKGLLPPI